MKVHLNRFPVVALIAAAGWHGPDAVLRRRAAGELLPIAEQGADGVIVAPGVAIDDAVHIDEKTNHWAKPSKSLPCDTVLPANCRPRWESI